MSDEHTLEARVAHAAGVAMCCSIIDQVKEHFDEPIPVLAGLLAALVSYALQHGATEELMHEQVRVSAEVSKDMPYMFEVAGNA